MSSSLKEIAGISDESVRAISAIWNSERGDIRSLIKAGGLDAATDFQGGDFRGWPLFGQDIRGINFAGADLRGTGVEKAMFDETTTFIDAIVDKEIELAFRSPSPAAHAHQDVRTRLAEVRRLCRHKQFRRALDRLDDVFEAINYWRLEWGTLKWAELLAQGLMTVRIPLDAENVTDELRQRVNDYKPKLHELTFDLLSTLSRGAMVQSRIAAILCRKVIDLYDGKNLLLHRDEVIEIFFAALEIEQKRVSEGYLTLMNSALKVAAVTQRSDLAKQIIAEGREVVESLKEASPEKALSIQFRLAVMEAGFRASLGQQADAAQMLRQAVGHQLTDLTEPFDHGVGLALIEAIELLVTLSSRNEYADLLRRVTDLQLLIEQPTDLATQRKYVAALQSLARTLGERGDNVAALSVIDQEIGVRRLIFEQSPTAQNGGYLVRAAMRYHTKAYKSGHTIDINTLNSIEDYISELHRRRPSVRNQRNLTEIAILRHAMRRDASSSENT